MDDFKLWRGITHQLSESCSNFDLSNAQKRAQKRRSRRFDTARVVKTVLELVAGPDRSYLNVLHESDPGKSSPAASSFCAARKKIPAAVFCEIQQDLLEHWDDNAPQPELWRGLRTFALDGSGINLPIPLKGKGFHVKKGSFYPMGLVTGLLRTSDRMICDLDFSSNLNEREAAKRILEKLNSRDLVIYDKGYFSFDLLCLHAELKIHALFLVQGGPSFKDIVDFRKSSETEKIVQINPSKETVQKHQKACPDSDIESVTLKLIKYEIEGKEYVLATTFLVEGIPIKEFVDLYHLRWRIEELYKSLKCTLKLEEFHSKDPNGVEQELRASSLLWNLARSLEGIGQPELKKSTCCSILSHYRVKFRQVLIIFGKNIRQILSPRKNIYEKALKSCVTFMLRHLELV